MGRLSLFLVLTSALFAAGPVLPEGATAQFIEVDSAGNGYVSGTLPGNDAFLIRYRLDSNERTFLQRFTALTISGITVDPAGAAYVIANGEPASRVGTRVPALLAPADSGIIVSKLAADGSVIYATFLGPTHYGADIAVSNEGEAYITGVLSKGELPASNNAAVKLDGNDRGFVAKLNALGNQIVWVNRGIGGRKIALDAAGNIYAAGVFRGGPELPTTPGALQSTHGSQPCGGNVFLAFSCDYTHVSKLDSTGSTLLYGTYLAGDYGSSTAAIAADPAGNLLIAGSTRSADFPVTTGVVDPTFGTTREPYVPTSFKSAVQPPAETGFVTKLNASGTGLTFSTFFGGSKTDRISDMRLGPDWIYLSGDAGSEDMPSLSVIKEECLPRGFAVRMKLDGTAVGPVEILDGSGNAVAADANGIVRTIGFESLDLSKNRMLRTCVTDAASRTQLSSVVPGQLISIFGNDLAARTESSTAQSGQLIPLNLSNLSVDFDGVPARMLYVSNRQANVVVPYEIAGRERVQMTLRTRLTLVFGRVEQFEFAVRDRTPATFQLLEPMEYCGQFSTVFIKPTTFVRNADGSVNRCANPAQSGSIVTIFVNGGAISNPASIAGLIASERTPVNVGVSVSSEGRAVEVVNFSLDPGSVTGVWRLDFRVPTVSSARPIEVTPTIDGKPIAQSSLFLFATP